jgi:hypothetical protein
MVSSNGWKFSSFEDLEAKWNKGQFDCDDIADFNDPMVLDWCSRLEDWAPKVALCFNRKTSAVTLDRISQHDMPELRRLVCYHKNVSMETLERLLNDFDKITVESAREALHKSPQYAAKLAPSHRSHVSGRRAASRRRPTGRRARSRRAAVRR